MFKLLHCDAPRSWGVWFQDPVSPIAEGLLDLNNTVFFYLIIIVGLVTCIFIICLFSFKDNKISYKYLLHGSLLEIIWTSVPALILLVIAIPSFKLIYLIDECVSPALTVKAVGNQWYWSYQYDFLDSNNELIEFDSYAIPESDLQPGELRLLDVDNRLVLPVDTSIRLIVTANDVIHSFALPSAGIKIDACPGRLNQANLYLQRPGLFYGQCSEICGTGHALMPICVEGVSVEKFLDFIANWD